MRGGGDGGGGVLRGKWMGLRDGKVRCRLRKGVGGSLVKCR